MEPHPDLTAQYAPDIAKPQFLKDLFDRGAPHYARAERIVSLGSGFLYRKNALQRASLAPGMRVLDVATGTGLVARAALQLGIAARDLVGLDPSAGMLREAGAPVAFGAVRGVADALPFADASFDFLCMGFALRHVGDLRATFAEYRRVLRPGATLLVLEISRPSSPLGYRVAKTYLQQVVPFVTRLGTRDDDAERMMRYYWHTIDACVAPQAILDAMTGAGLRVAPRKTYFGMFSEYRGAKR
ncbi:class I SAM-dependent methyltransferase [Candidatus Binatia bacterium]|nr:class I SAM-dependent methyltransferase [Candidatus Binatia bacterium]